MKLITCLTCMTLILLSGSAIAADNENLLREKISFSQKIDSTSRPNFKDTGMENRSLVFYRQVSGAELSAGVDMMVDADSAVIQLSPLDQVKNGSRVEKTQVPLEMTLSKGNITRDVNDESIALQRKTMGLRQNFPEIYGRAHVMQIPGEMGRGKFRLQAKNVANKNDAYILYVLDKSSSLALNVKTPRNRYTNKDNLEFEAFVDSNQSVEVASMASTLISPNGNRYSIAGKMDGDRYKANWPINIDEPRLPGALWQVEVRSRARNKQGEIFERVAVVATDIYEKTAEVKDVDTNSEALQLTLDVKKSGRYEVRALVYGVDTRGNANPLVLNYQAEWLEPGQQRMSFNIDTAQLDVSGGSTSYEVRDIQLLDQTRLAVLESKSGQWKLP